MRLDLRKGMRDRLQTLKDRPSQKSDIENPCFKGNVRGFIYLGRYRVKLLPIKAVTFTARVGDALIRANRKSGVFTIQIRE